MEVVRRTLLRRSLIPLACLALLAAVDATTRYIRRAYPQGFSAAPQASRSDPRFLAEPVPLTAFSATDLDGRDVSLAGWHGKVAVVNFWATWCLPCRREIPALVTLQDKYKAELVVVGVLQDGASIDFVRAFARNLRVNYPIVRSNAEIEASFAEVLALPTTFVVDGAGRVVSVHVGEIDPKIVEREVTTLVARQ
jgi:thiol-disulfide isomerase/thioredoxin